jgi:hypothetical protein
MGPEFFQTPMGRRFYEVTAPKLAEELARLNRNLEALVELMRALAKPEAPAAVLPSPVCPPGDR